MIEIHFDPKEISYKELLEMFWNNHEYRASARLKREYMSMIMYHSEEQRLQAEASKAEQQAREGDEVVVTEIVPESHLYPAAKYAFRILPSTLFLTNLIVVIIKNIAYKDMKTWPRV